MRARTLTLTAAFVAALAMSAAAQDSLTIYTYDSFTASWGPGPVIEETFEAECDCEVGFVSVADGVALLNRLRLEGENTEADIVLGIDTNLIAEAKETGLFVPHGISLENVDVPGGWNDEVFVPYDYGYFAFVYDTEVVEAPPTSLRELVEGGPEPAIVIQDPRTSTPGLGLMLARFQRGVGKERDEARVFGPGEVRQHDRELAHGVRRRGANGPVLEIVCRPMPGLLHTLEAELAVGTAQLDVVLLRDLADLHPIEH